MKLKKFLALTATVAMAMSMVVGCGNNGDGAADEGNDAA